MPQTDQVRTTPLHQLHQQLGGRLVPFAGWELPIQYEGVIAEHTWCRSSAALFDVTHMGVIELHPPAGSPGGEPGVQVVAKALETLTPAAITTLAPGRQRYALLTNDAGGVIDDLMVVNRGGFCSLVVNASRREVDLAHLRSRLAPTGVEVTERADLGLLALQGPKAVTALTRLAPGVGDLVFGDFASVDLQLVDGSGTTTGRLEAIGVTRSGYTGEDGFELMVPATGTEALARSLLDQPEVLPAGLGARDTLRLEAGLTLYGNDLDETTSPVEAGLAWTVPKQRREEGGFPGAPRIIAEHDQGPARRRVGLRPQGRRPVRDGAQLQTLSGEPAGIVTSGGYGPTIGGPVAMGYVSTELAAEGQELVADVRGSAVKVSVASLPFTPHNYHRGA